jgi:midasin (ATPase involved in ribosome maturation)
MSSYRKRKLTPREEEIKEELENVDDLKKKEYRCLSYIQKRLEEIKSNFLYDILDSVRFQSEHRD